ncbi:hypothetical protein VNO77_39138 [Canavalia gladiata]|uniref:Uncharacterized protein n=1 Tax=Canavalia gladiata TaxID=3824 RepID=A0AAN9KCM3_CANGL
MCLHYIDATFLKKDVISVTVALVRYIAVSIVDSFAPEEITACLEAKVVTIRIFSGSRIGDQKNLTTPLQELQDSGIHFSVETARGNLEESRNTNRGSDRNFLFLWILSRRF